MYYESLGCTSLLVHVDAVVNLKWGAWMLLRQSHFVRLFASLGFDFLLCVPRLLRWGRVLAGSSRCYIVVQWLV